METAEQIKEVVRQKYGAMAEQPTIGPTDANGCSGPTSCCGPTSPGPETVANVPIDMTVGYLHPFAGNRADVLRAGVTPKGVNSPCNNLWPCTL